MLAIAQSRSPGKERDAETGLDYFGARYYGSNMGRWMSPDWAAKPVTVPYAQFGDPQSLNLYSYVLNNPLAKGDLDGHGEWYDKRGNDLGTDGVNDGAVIVATGKVSYSSDRSLIDVASSDMPLASFSRAEGMAMHDAVARSNGKTADDRTGGMHEEGFSTTNGVISVAPAGPAYKPGDDTVSITVPTTTESTLKAHVHPAGNGSTQFEQTPSSGPGQDLSRVNRTLQPNMTNAVVGAGSGRVYIYNEKGVQATVPLDAFPERQQDEENDE